MHICTLFFQVPPARREEHGCKPDLFVLWHGLGNNRRSVLVATDYFAAVTQRWKKMEVADAPAVLFFHTCAFFSSFFPCNFKKGLAFFCAVFGIFTNFFTSLSIFCTYFVC